MVPSSDHPKKLRRFYDCLAELMTFQLQSLCLASISDYTHFICDVGVSKSLVDNHFIHLFMLYLFTFICFPCRQYQNPGLKIGVSQKNKTILFEPTFQQFQNAILGVYENLVDATNNLPRLETKLYLDWEGSREFLKVYKI